MNANERAGFDEMDRTYLTQLVVSRTELWQATVAERDAEKARADKYVEALREIARMDAGDDWARMYIARAALGDTDD